MVRYHLMCLLYASRLAGLLESHRLLISLGFNSREAY